MKTTETIPCAHRICLLAIAASVLMGCDEKSGRGEHEEAESEPTSSLSRSDGGEVVVKLEEDALERATLEFAAVKVVSLRPQARAYGRVLDPEPLVALHDELAGAEIAARNSGAQFERTRTLFEDDENASRRALEAAEAQLRTDENQARAIRNRIQLQWGEDIGAMKADDFNRLVQTLLARKASLIRADVPVGEGKWVEPPKEAEVLELSGGTNFVTARVLSRAPTANEALPGHGFLLLTPPGESAWRPGTRVTALLPLSVEPESGVLIPRSAVLRHTGETWVYVRAEPDKFLRRRITLVHPTAEGWFVREGVEPRTELVVAGAQALLSEELKAQIQLDD